MNASYTYRIRPWGKAETVKRTRGSFSHVTEPTGFFGFRYAVFVNRASEICVPLHDLTPETKARIGL